MSDSQKVFVSVLGAVVGHLLFFLALAVLFTLSSLLPARSSHAAAPPPPPEEFTILLSDLIGQIEEIEPPQEVPEDFTRSYTRTDADQESAEKPENARFHSDRNTVAASDRTPDRSRPEDMPAVAGRADLPFIEIRDREHVDGEFLEASLASVPQAAASQPPAPPRPEAADAAPPAPSQAVASEALEPAEADRPTDRAAERETQPEALPSEAAPMLASREASFETPFAAEPAARPREMEETDREAAAEREADDSGEAAAPRPEAAPPAPPVARRLPPDFRERPSTPSPPQSASADLPPNPRPPSEDPAFSPHTRARSMDGGADRVGNVPAFNVEASVLGRYKKEVTQAVERQWHRYREQNGSFVTYGTLKVRFRVDAKGTPRNLKLVKNNSNAVMADFTLRAVMDADIPPMPPEVASVLGATGLEINYDVIVY